MSEMESLSSGRRQHQQQQHQQQQQQQHQLQHQQHHQQQQKTLPQLPLNDWDRYKPVDRSAWWRDQLTGFPNVGQYEPKETSTLQLVSYPSSTFKSSGRQREWGVVAKGDELLPGAYNHRSFTDELAKDTKTYSFRNSKKTSLEALTEGLIDRQLMHLTPGQYNVETYLSIRSDPEPVKGANFKSRTRRVIKEFEPREGPAPGAYDSSRSTLSQRGVRSSFRSACPRFPSSYSKVPAPGFYDKSYQTPMPASMMRLGRQHGLFFSTAFDH